MKRRPQRWGMGAALLALLCACGDAPEETLSEFASPDGDYLLRVTRVAARGSDGVAIPELPGARLQRSYVNDEARLEIKSFPPAKREWLKSLGCFTEIIAYKTRLFVPTNRAEDILVAISANATP